jgi:hypothetical protein
MLAWIMTCMMCRFQLRGEAEVQVKARVLQSSLASRIMCWPELVPHTTGAFGPAELALNCAFWHCVRPFGLLSPGLLVDGCAMMKVSKPSRIWQMSADALQTEKMHGEASPLSLK